ncbi:hypothetical protein [Streptomyces sp. NPDC050528]
MAFIENVASGLLVTLIIWGTRQARIHWRRRHTDHTSGQEASES